MKEAVNLIVLAIPIFFILIGVEIIIDKLRRTGYYRFNDTISNLNAGITEQITGAFAKLIVVGIYAYVFNHYKLVTMPSNVFTWVLLFIGVDFFYYWFHRYAHEINFLWGGHVVHHQSEEYNLSVALRQGAFQKYGSFIFYLPLAFIGFDTWMFITISQIQTLYQFWIHTKTIHKLSAPVEYVFNTPSHHRVHHGRNPKYIDRNHGGTFIIWDRMFGTFQQEEEQVIYGITKPLHTWNPIRAQLDFWKDLFRDLRKTKNVKNKIKLLIYAPGWLPHELKDIKTPFQQEDSLHTKYNTIIDVKLNYYVFVQFIIALSIASYFLFSFDTFTLSVKIVFAVSIIFSLTCIGNILEVNNKAYRMEIVRLLFFPIAYSILVVTNQLQSFYCVDVLALIFISAVSGVWFYTLRKSIV